MNYKCTYHAYIYFARPENPNFFFKMGDRFGKMIGMLTTILKKKFGFIVLLMWVSLLALVHVSLEDSTSTLGSCVHGLLEDTLGKWNLET